MKSSKFSSHLKLVNITVVIEFSAFVEDWKLFIARQPSTVICIVQSFQSVCMSVGLSVTRWYCGNNWTDFCAIDAA